MSGKQFLYESDAREALRRGVDAVARVISVTLGPRGRTVALEKKFGPPLLIDDGATIARDIEFADRFGDFRFLHEPDIPSKPQHVC